MPDVLVSHPYHFVEEWKKLPVGTKIKLEVVGIVVAVNPSGHPDYPDELVVRCGSGVKKFFPDKRYDDCIVREEVPAVQVATPDAFATVKTGVPRIDTEVKPADTPVRRPKVFGRVESADDLSR